jgi:hypothetical protein
VRLHIHFNGAGGNVGSGKYNDGSPENRPVLAGRLAEGMKRGWEGTTKSPAADLDYHWATRNVALPLSDLYDEAERTAAMHNTTLPVSQRVKAARDIAWARRVNEGRTITMARLRLGPIDILHLPGELFVEYQLAAQGMRPDAFVCVAAYGDYGPGYIGTAEAYAQGGYETGSDSRVSRVSPRVERVIMTSMNELLQ